MWCKAPPHARYTLYFHCSITKATRQSIYKRLPWKYLNWLINRLFVFLTLFHFFRFIVWDKRHLSFLMIVWSKCCAWATACGEEQTFFSWKFVCLQKKLFQLPNKNIRMMFSLCFCYELLRFRDMIPIIVGRNSY